MRGCTFPSCGCGGTGYCAAAAEQARHDRIAMERARHDALAERGFHRAILILFVIGVVANVGLAAYMAMRYLGAAD